MKSAHRSRRLLAVLAGLAIGLGGVFAAAVPAQATARQFAEAEVETFPTCEGTYVFFSSDSELVWAVTAGDETIWPKDGDEQPDAGETGFAFVPFEAGGFAVTYEGAGEGWPRTPDIRHPEECELLGEPTAVAPTCAVEAGQIVIPDLFAEFDPADLDLNLTLIRLDGTEVENDSTHLVQPGTHTVTLSLASDNYPTEVVLKTWVIEITRADCPDLPVTGSRTGLVAGIAVVLLAFGSGLYVLGRRRRVNPA